MSASFAGHLDSSTSIRRVLAVTVLVGLLFSGIQSLLELAVHDKYYETNKAVVTPFSHGGILFWLITSSLFLLVRNTFHVYAC